MPSRDICTYCWTAELFIDWKWIQLAAVTAGTSRTRTERGPPSRGGRSLALVAAVAAVAAAAAATCYQYYLAVATPPLVYRGTVPLLIMLTAGRRQASHLPIQHVPVAYG